MTVDDQKSFRGLMRSLREDLIANRGDWSGAGFHAVALYRFGAWGRNRGGFIGRLVKIVYKILFVFVRNLYCIDLPRSAKIGRRLQIPHPAGIVISYQAEIGDDCLIRQNVTIGRFDRGRDRKPPHAPRLGNGVEVGAGAVIVGGITIGDGARIGPNAVVMTDIPAGGPAFSPPAKTMKPLRPRKGVRAQ